MRLYPRADKGGGPQGRFLEYSYAQMAPLLLREQQLLLQLLLLLPQRRYPRLMLLLLLHPADSAVTTLQLSC